MEEKKKTPTFPSNYVSLLQLEERWEQKRKQKDKEDEPEEKQKQHQQPQNEMAVPKVPSNFVTLQELEERWVQRRKQKEKEDEQEEKQKQHLQPQNELAQGLQRTAEVRSTPDRQFHRKNRSLTARSSSNRLEESAAETAVAAVIVEGDEDVNATKENRSEGSQFKRKKKKKKSYKKKGNGGKPNAQEEVGSTGLEANARPFTEEEKNFPGERYGKRKELQTNFRQKTGNVVEKVMENERKSEKEVKERTEIEQKLDNLVINEETDIALQRQNSSQGCELRDGDRRNGKFRDEHEGSNRSYGQSREFSNGGYSRSNGLYRGYNGGVNQSNGQFRRYDWDFDYGNRRYRGGYQKHHRPNRGEEGMFDGMVWVKKERDTDDGVAAAVDKNSSIP